MNRLLQTITSLYRPEVADRAWETRTDIQYHRLLTLFGAFLTLTVGLLQMALSPEGAAPAWPSFLVGSLFVGGLVASYLSRTVRRFYVGSTRALLYLLMGWLTIMTVAGGFADGDAAILLFVYAILTPAVGYGGRSVWPAVRFGGFGILLMAGGMILTAAPEGRPLFLLGCMVATAVVESLWANLLTQSRDSKRLGIDTDQEPTFPSVTEHVPVALFRTAPGDGIVYANRAFAETFGYRNVVDILLADLDTFFADPDERERLWAKAKRKGGIRGAEVKLIRKDREVFTGLLNIRVAYNENQELICCDGTLTDISERKQREEARQESLARLARKAEQRDYGTDGHLDRVGKLARLLAAALGQPPEWQSRIEAAAPFHDVGKIAITDDILRKPGPLTDKERQAVKEHASIGPTLLSGGVSDRLQTARQIARSHHERWDGDGYPDGLEGEEIPLAARIVAVADAFDAMTHDRPYREAMPLEEVFAVIEEEAGAQFDPQVSEAALHCREAMGEIVTGEDPPAESITSIAEIKNVASGAFSLSFQSLN